MTRTRSGKNFIAVGDNIGGATRIGIPVVWTKVLAYILSGIFAAVAGVAFASKYGQVNIVAGAGYEMSAIAACVLGGVSLSGGLGSLLVITSYSIHYTKLYDFLLLIACWRAQQARLL